MDRKVTYPVPRPPVHPPSTVHDGSSASEQRGTLSLIIKKIGIKLRGLGIVFRLTATSKRTQIDKSGRSEDTTS